MPPKLKTERKIQQQASPLTKRSPSDQIVASTPKVSKVTEESSDSSEIDGQVTNDQANDSGIGDGLELDDRSHKIQTGSFQSGINKEITATESGQQPNTPPAILPITANKSPIDDYKSMIVQYNAISISELVQQPSQSSFTRQVVSVIQKVYELSNGVYLVVFADTNTFVLSRVQSDSLVREGYMYLFSNFGWNADTKMINFKTDSLKRMIGVSRNFPFNLLLPLPTNIEQYKSASEPEVKNLYVDVVPLKSVAQKNEKDIIDVKGRVVLIGFDIGDRQAVYIQDDDASIVEITAWKNSISESSPLFSIGADIFVNCAIVHKYGSTTSLNINRSTKIEIYTGPEFWSESWSLPFPNGNLITVESIESIVVYVRCPQNACSPKKIDIPTDQSPNKSVRCPYCKNDFDLKELKIGVVATVACSEVNKPRIDQKLKKLFASECLKLVNSLPAFFPESDKSINATFQDISDNFIATLFEMPSRTFYILDQNNDRISLIGKTWYAPAVKK